MPPVAASDCEKCRARFASIPGAGSGGSWLCRGRRARGCLGMTLLSLLSQVLMLFTLEFDRTSKTPLAICANAVRVIGNSVVPQRELPHLTGCSPETINVGWQLKPYVNATTGVQRGRGKVLRLTPLGLKAACEYPCHVALIEKRWADEHGHETSYSASDKAWRRCSCHLAAVLRH